MSNEMPRHGATLFHVYGSQQGEAILTFDVTLVEAHEMESMVTEHPVENGGTIADHIISRPRSLNMTALVTQSSLYEMGSRLSVQEAHLALKKVMDDRLPVLITTSMGEYGHVVMTRYSVTRNSKTSNVLEADMSFTEVTLAKVLRVALPENIRSKYKASGKADDKNTEDTAKPPTPSETEKVRKSYFYRIGEHYGAWGDKK